ncbi:MAG: hypothetical protein IJJ69_14235 [Oscillospiraceae bacterium]|nr:hypothetical protein [Oscillospiraceae bacterium]
MENKKKFVHELGKLLGKYVYRLNVKEFDYQKDEQGEEFVLISFNDGFQKKICITGDSELAVMQDVAKRLS